MDDGFKSAVGYFEADDHGFITYGMAPTWKRYGARM